MEWPAPEYPSRLAMIGFKNGDMNQFADVNFYRVINPFKVHIGALIKT